MHYEKFADGTVKCIEDEIPFEIPDSWAWTRLKSISIMNPKNNPDDQLEVSFVPMANIRGGFNNSFVSDKRLWNKVKTGFTHFIDGDLGIAKITPCFENKKSVVFRGLINGYGAGTTELHILRMITMDIIPEYLLCFIKRDEFILGGVQTFLGDVGQQRVTKDYIANYLVAIPPIKEQTVIIAKIKSANSIIDNIQDSKINLQELISKAKSRILNLALRGKLVPQDANDEPASMLLERIKAEKEELIKQGKIKREKTESAIFKGDDNSYYDDIPKNWAECSILHVADVELGKTLDTEKNKGDYRPYLRSVNIKWNKIDLNDIKEMRFENDELERYSIIKGDLLICEGGDVGRCCVWNLDNQIFYQNALHRVRFYGNCNPQYFAYILIYLESIDYLKRISNGVTIKHLTKNVLSSISFLLPPLAEQKRIVETIEKYFAHLDNIAQSLM